MHTSLKISIRLSKTSVTSISLKIPIIALWGMLGSQRDYIFKDGYVDENSSPSIYAKTYRALSDFAFFWISKYLQKYESSSKKGMSDFVLNCLVKDIIKSSIPGNHEKEVPKYSPKDYAIVLKEIEKGY